MCYFSLQFLHHFPVPLDDALVLGDLPLEADHVVLSPGVPHLLGLELVLHLVEVLLQVSQVEVLVQRVDLGHIVLHLRDGLVVRHLLVERLLLQ